MLRLLRLSPPGQSQRYARVAHGGLDDQEFDAALEDSGGSLSRHSTEEEKENPTNRQDSSRALVGSMHRWNLSRAPDIAKTVRDLALNSLIALLPSFIPIWQSEHHYSRPRSHPTAWLDGLRGVAAFFVLFHHGFYLFFPSSHRGWGSSPPEENRWLFQLPFIRIVHSGTGMVSIFLIVSGFALSYKPLELIRSRNTSKLLDVLSSAVFRRWMRLYLPILFVTFCDMIATSMNFYGTGPGSRVPPHANSFSDQICHWLTTFQQYADPFRSINHDNFSSPYDENLWTIPQEFHGSMVVFITVVALAKTTVKIRLVILTCLCWYCFWSAYSQLCLFLSGMLLADLRFAREGIQGDLRNSDQEPNCVRSILPRHYHRYYSTSRISFWILIFLIGIYLASTPSNSSDSPGFRTLSTWIPQRWGDFSYRFLPSIAAVQIVCAIDNLRFLQSIFTSQFAQYLGKISFSLYMVHGPMLYTFGWYIMAKTSSLTGQDTQLQYGLGRALGAVLLVPSIFWVADVVTRLVDENCVSFAKWLANTCFVAD